MESKKEQELSNYYVPRHEFESEKNEIFKDFSKETNKLRDKIDEVDDKHTQNFHQMQRNLDQYIRSTDSLNESVKALNDSVTKMSQTLSGNMDEIRNMKSRVEKTESTISEQESLKQQRKIEIIKSFTSIMVTLLGAGGLVSWLGPIIFGR